MLQQLTTPPAQRRRSWRRLALVLVALLACGVGALTDAPQRAPIDPVDEPLPPMRSHYLVSNEARHDLFAVAIAGRGGAYLGVGADQSYTMIAVAESSLAFIVDHDRKILDLHRELGRRIRGAEDPARLLAGLIDPRDPPPPRLTDAWPAMVQHLHRVAARRQGGRPTTWLGDPALYARVRERWRSGAIFLVLGDLAGDAAMRSIADAAASRGVDFSVIYLSNAEESLATSGRLADNLDALPRSRDTVLLRTRSRGPDPADGLWSYEREGLGELVARLRAARRGADRVHDLVSPSSPL